MCTCVSIQVPTNRNPSDLFLPAQLLCQSETHLRTIDSLECICWKGVRLCNALVYMAVQTKVLLQQKSARISRVMEHQDRARQRRDTLTPSSEFTGLTSVRRSMGFIYSPRNTRDTYNFSLRGIVNNSGLACP